MSVIPSSICCPSLALVILYFLFFLPLWLSFQSLFWQVPFSSSYHLPSGSHIAGPHLLSLYMFSLGELIPAHMACTAITIQTTQKSTVVQSCISAYLSKPKCPTICLSLRDPKLKSSSLLNHLHSSESLSLLKAPSPS